MYLRTQSGPARSTGEEGQRTWNNRPQLRPPGLCQTRPGLLKGTHASEHSVHHTYLYTRTLTTTSSTRTLQTHTRTVYHPFPTINCDHFTISPCVWTLVRSRRVQAHLGGSYLQGDDILVLELEGRRAGAHPLCHLLQYSSDIFPRSQNNPSGGSQYKRAKGVRAPRYHHIDGYMVHAIRTTGNHR